MASSQNTSKAMRLLESTESLSPSENTNNSANKTIIYICGLLLVVVLFVQINYQTSYQAPTNNLVYCEGASNALQDLSINEIVNPMKQISGAVEVQLAVKEKQTNLSVVEIENEKEEQEEIVNLEEEILVLSEKQFVKNFEKQFEKQFLKKFEKQIAEKLAKKFIPQMYVITPTYARSTQKSDLTSVLQAAAASRLRIHFILVEDTTRPEPSTILKHFAEDYPRMNDNLKLTLLTQKTVAKTNGHRGVYQRNAGLDWVAKNQVNSSAVVYFGDDDNTYDQRVYHEFSQVGTKGTIIGVLPVGLSGGVKYEGPLCNANGSITGWHASYRPERTFALDMAGFAFTVQTLLDTGARMDAHWPGGRLETLFATTVTNISNLAFKDLSVADHNKVLPLADCGKHVYVWHTKTKEPGKLHDFGPRLEVKK